MTFSVIVDFFLLCTITVQYRNRIDSLRYTPDLIHRVKIDHITTIWVRSIQYRSIPIRCTDSFRSNTDFIHFSWSIREKEMGRRALMKIRGKRGYIGSDWYTFLSGHEGTDADKREEKEKKQWGAERGREEANGPVFVTMCHQHINWGALGEEKRQTEADKDKRKRNNLQRGGRETNR